MSRQTYFEVQEADPRLDTTWPVRLCFAEETAECISKMNSYFSNSTERSYHLTVHLEFNKFIVSNSEGKISYAWINQKSRTISPVPPFRGSFNSAIVGEDSILLKNLKGIKAILRISNSKVPVIAADMVLDCPFPVGTLEETRFIETALANNSKLETSKGFSIHLGKSKFLIALPLWQLHSFASNWWGSLNSLRHEVEQAFYQKVVSSASISPIIFKSAIVGVAGFDLDSRGFFYLNPSNKRQEFIEMIGEWFSGNRYSLILPKTRQLNWPLSESLSLIENGFLLEGKDPEFHIFSPPSCHSTFIECATVVLINPQTKQILVGRRKTEPWLDYLCFPGGKVEAGETTRQAAQRELLEETGVAIDLNENISAVVGFSRFKDKLYRIHTYIVQMPSDLNFQATEELSPFLISIDSEAEFAPATGRLVRHLRTIF